MATTTDTFILELKLNTNQSDVHILNKRFRIATRMHNTLLSKELKKLTIMKQSKKYRKLLKEYFNPADAVSKKAAGASLTAIHKENEFTDYGIQSHIKSLQHNYKRNIDSNTSQKIASNVYQSIASNLYKGAKKVHFKGMDQLESVEGKNDSGIMFRKGKIVWLGLSIPVIIRKNDLFAQESLERRVKYCRIVKKIIKGSIIYYVQLVLEGTPPAKRINSTGQFRHQIATTSKVGIDIGTSTIAISSTKEVKLLELAPISVSYDKNVAALKRKLDRSRRFTNPDNFNANGTIKKGIKLNWICSKNYIKVLYQLKEASRLKAAYMKESHNKLSNYILSLGNECYIEQMDFKKLVKKKKRSKNKKGKDKSRKAFGKSIINKAPAMLMSILDRKLSYQGKKLLKVNTYTFRASQYHHDTNLYIKEALSKRYKEISNLKVQRDLYSAYLLMNSKPNLKETDRNLCLKNFNDFIYNHNVEIKRIISSKEKTPISFGILELV